MKALILTLACTLFCCTSALASQKLIKADGYIDVQAGKVVTDIAVLVADNRIVRVARQNQIKATEDTQVIDLSGHYLVPGLFDMHIHLTADPNHHGYSSLGISTPREAITGVASAKSTLEAGFTSGRNLGAGGYSDVALKQAIDEGVVPGPRLFVSGPSISITGGHCDNNLLPFEYDATSEGVADGPWTMVQKVRQNIKYGANTIKLCVTGGVLSKGTKVGAQQMHQSEITAAVEEAHRRGMIVAAHAHGTEGIRAAILGGVDSIEHASFMTEQTIRLALKHGVYLSMDIYTTEHILGEGKKAGILQESLDKEKKVGVTQRASFTKAVKAGVKMVYATDAGVFPHGQNGKQFSRMIRFGMTPIQAIQAATIEPARLLQVDKTLGSIEPGKLADIIAVKGDPIANIGLFENVAWVMQDGKIIKQD